MGIRLMQTALANVIAAGHIAYFVAVVVGLIAIATDSAPWTRNIWFRVSHFIAIAVVVIENLGAFRCPLNIVEWRLRTATTGVGETSVGVGGILDGLLFHTLSGSVLNTLWWLFAVSAIILFFVKPPASLDRSRRKSYTGLKGITRRTVLCLAVGLLGAAIGLRAQSTDQKPLAFEVASIKLSDPSQRRLYSISGQEATAVGVTVNDLIVFAYGVHARQISGAPTWVESDKFDIRGKPEGGGRPNPTQFKAMLQKLLADRFLLAFHRDKKQLRVYALTAGKNGTKLTRSEAASPIPNLIPRGPGNWPVQNATMGEVAGVMQSHLDRPVVDQTGLQGRFDFHLQWTPDETTRFTPLGEPPQPPVGGDTPPDLFTAIQEQLGLKLEPANAPVDVLVIDHVERPTPD